MKHKKRGKVPQIRKTWKIDPVTQIEPMMKKELLQDQLDEEIEAELRNMGYHPEGDDMV